MWRFHILIILGLILHGLNLAHATSVELSNSDTQDMPVAIPWAGSTVRDLHKEYGNIFLHGNRNAASHLWSSFLLQRSGRMSPEKVELMFSGFCAISGSPVRANDYNRYKLTLPLVSGQGQRTGFMHYCCCPCVCDTQDYIRVDTKTVQTIEGPKVYHFAVIGNPCDHPEKLDESFIQPFGRRHTTLRNEAREVRCSSEGELIGATVSDHGYIIIGLFFDLLSSETLALEAPPSSQDSGAERVPQPGRVTTIAGKLVQDEFEYAPQCTQRAEAGYNSGMGEIFRKVADISRIDIPSPDMVKETCDGAKEECTEVLAKEEL